MKKIILIIILLGLNLFALNTTAKYDILKTKLVQQLKTQKYSKAIKTISDIKSLGISIPKSFSYFEGKALYETGDYKSAYIKFEQYIDTNGKKGKYYQKSITYLIKAEEKQEDEIEKEKKKKITKARDVIVSTIYLGKLKISDEVIYGKKLQTIHSVNTNNNCKITFDAYYKITDRESRKGIKYTNNVEINFSMITRILLKYSKVSDEQYRKLIFSDTYQGTSDTRESWYYVPDSVSLDKVKNAMEVLQESCK